MQNTLAAHTALTSAEAYVIVERHYANYTRLYDKQMRVCAGIALFSWGCLKERVVDCWKAGRSVDYMNMQQTAWMLACRAIRDWRRAAGDDELELTAIRHYLEQNSKGTDHTLALSGFGAPVPSFEGTGLDKTNLAISEVFQDFDTWFPLDEMVRRCGGMTYPMQPPHGPLSRQEYPPRQTGRLRS